MGRTRQGSFRQGGGVPTARLTPAKVRQIRAARKRGVTLAELAQRYQTTVSNIHYICTRRTWAHVE